MAKVFIVEDHKTLRELLAELLGRADGLEVCGCSGTAEKALECLEGAGAELALIDVSLPGRSGIELVREIKRRSMDIVCVMLSGHLSSRYVDEARAAGAKAYVGKSQLQELISVLQDVQAGGSRFPSF